MDILWRDGPVSCRHVFNELNRSDNYAYTTVLTMMKRLEAKGVVRHTEDGRTFIYHTVVDKDVIEHRMLSDFIASAFAGSPLSLVNALLRLDNLDEKELRQIEESLNAIRRGDKDD